MKFLKRLVFVLPLILSASCSTNLPDYATLGALRILALKADIPEKDDASNTSNIVITPVISDLNAAGTRTLSYTATLCNDPGITLGATPLCTAQVPNFLSLSSGAVTLTGPIGTYTGTGPTITLPQASIPLNLTAGLPLFNQFNGVALIVNYILTASDGTQVQAIKRIVSSTSAKPTKNTNPSITSVNTVGQNGNIVTLNVTTSTPETYTTMSTSGVVSSQQETLINTWFIADGSMSFDRTVGSDNNTWTQPNTRPIGRSELIVVVTRDGRGGEDYLFMTY